MKVRREPVNKHSTKLILNSFNDDFLDIITYE